MPQAGSRKRAAPGACPTDKASGPAAGNHGSQVPPLSADQFLQWNLVNNSANPVNNASPSQETPRATTYANMDTKTMRAEPSNQLTRMPGTNQMMPRAPTYNSNGSELWAAQLAVPQQQQKPTEQSGQFPPQQDDEAQLDKKAAEAKKQSQAARKSIPPFVQKLSSFLDEKRNTELIRWSPKGDSFVVLDEDEFARTLIPELFKHNNYASFVRQLNMYGFHKRVGLSDNSMRASERKNKSPSEYYNQYFKRGKPNLLWLIQKPKPLAQGRKRGGKQDDNVDDDGDDGYDGDNIVSGVHSDEQVRGPRQPLLIGAGETGMAREELSQVHQELQTIRSQQSQISQVLQKIRREHEQLYGQAAAFQKLHSRHENSINAILTFLATVYSRSLDGQGKQNLENLFTHDMQLPGSVVDMGDYRSSGVDTQTGLIRRPSQKQLLLHAPPASSPNIGAESLSNADSPQPRPRTGASGTGGDYQNPQHARVVEEIYDQDPTTPSQANFAADTPQSQADSVQNDIMSFINSANAQNNNKLPGRMEFPEALSHLQNADGKSPLSPAQRNDVLRLIAGNNGQQPSTNGNNNNALISPEPPDVPAPDLENWNSTNQDLQYLEKTLREHGDKVDQLSNMLQPLSPSGSIPGLDNPNEYVPPPDGLPDFNQIFNTDDYFANADNSGIDFGNPANDFTNNNDWTFDNNNNNLGPAFDMDGVNDQADDGRVVETVDSSEATSPANTVMDTAGQEEEPTSPRKRRRRN